MFHCLGTNVGEAKELLLKSRLQITSADDLEDAARKAVASIRQWLLYWNLKSTLKPRIIPPHLTIVYNVDRELCGEELMSYLDVLHAFIVKCRFSRNACNIFI